MSSLLILLMTLGSACDSGDVFRLDGDVTRDGDLAVFQNMEEMLGLKHTLGSSLITAIERRGKVAMAKRLGLPILEHELRSAFREHPLGPKT